MSRVMLPCASYRLTDTPANSNCRLTAGVSWMSGVSACENRQNRVSHGESVRVGSSVYVLVLMCFSGT